MRLTCHDCGSTIYISNEAPNCPECGAKLESHLRALEYVRDCYRQASDETLAGNDEQALLILAQGLSSVNASELHLLAALIHRKQGEYDGMHRHVAAIPVDDPLRPEGEWLLRSHQQKQRAERQAQKEYQPPAHAGKATRQLSPEFYSVPPTLDSPLRRRLSSRRRGWWIALPIAGLLAFLLLRQPLADGLALFAPNPTGLTTNALSEKNAADTVPTLIPTTILIVAPTPAPTQVPTQPLLATNEPTTAPTPPPTMPLPAPIVVAPSTESAPAEPQPIAAINAALADAIATAAVNQFNLAFYLQQANRGDLAILPIVATLREGRLTLSGIVPFTSHRLETIALAEEMPGVATVDAIDLVVRLPEVYTVQDGDTLWTIAYYLYGDGSRWEDVYAANEALLGNTILLDVGMELQVSER